jgi:hypothetical protein
VLTLVMVMVVVAMIVLAHTGKLSLGSQPSKQGQARPGRGRVRAINSPGEPLAPTATAMYCRPSTA